MNRVKSLTLTQLFCGARLFSICIDFEFDFEFFFLVNGAFAIHYLNNSSCFDAVYFFSSEFDPIKMAHQVKILRQTISVCAQFIVYCTLVLMLLLLMPLPPRYASNSILS